MRTVRPLSRFVLMAACGLALASDGLAARGTSRNARGESSGRTDEPAAAPRLIPEIPFTKYVLPNGLTLIVHEDHKAPIAAVNVWYHVGSKNEKRGRTGFAHLFEHLMFNGSENNKGEYFEPFERAGATGQNGTTNSDRTNYFQNIPIGALDMALWMESDRMGHLLGVLDDAKLVEQRGVVQNEKRQGENQPYGRVWTVLGENTYPSDHPYSWSVIGSMEDLDAASLDDVKEWFRSYYGAANAVVVVAGDVTAEDVHARVSKYFGDIPAGPPVARPERWIAARTGTKRSVMEDRVPQARIYMSWNVPEWGDPDADDLSLFGDILAGGKSSRLYRRLVVEDRLATDVGAYVYAREIAGQFGLQATAKPGQDLAPIETIIREEMARLLADGPTAAELERVKIQGRAGFIRGIERIGGFGGKSDVLANSEVYTGRPDAYRDQLLRSEAATAEQITQTARRWLSDGVFVLEVLPYKERKDIAKGIDRSSGVPTPPPPVAPAFPELQRVRLDNGLDVIVVERHAIPKIEMNLLVDAGYAADSLGKPGTASLVTDMLDEGTTSRTSAEISESLDMLGAELASSSNLDMTSVRLSALTETLGPALEIYADILLAPAFPQAEVERLKAERLAAIAREKTEPGAMSMRLMPGLIYGEGHAYAQPLTGSGTAAAVSSLTRDDLAAFHSTWFRPGNATLIIVGDTTSDAILPEVHRLFGGWEDREAPRKNLAEVKRPTSPVVYLVDRPGSLQSTIIAAHVAPPESSPDDLAIDAMNLMLGGNFSSRINMNLREDKHWSYGSRSSAAGARGQRPFYVSAPVQTDKTAESMREVLGELVALRTTKPPTEDELQKAKDTQTLVLSGRWETMDAVANSVSEIVRFGHPDRYFDTFASRVRGLKVEDLRAAAKTHVSTEGLTWLVIGDLAKIEAPIRALNFGPVHVIDADGRSAEVAPAVGQ